MGSVMSVQEAYERGYQLRCEGRYAEARSALQEVLATEPNHPDATWQIGLVQGFEGDFEGSIETLRNLVKAHPNHVNGRFDLAMTLMMMGYSEEACVEFHEVLRLEPTHQKAQQQLVYCE